MSILFFPHPTHVDAGRILQIVWAERSRIFDLFSIAARIEKRDKTTCFYSMLEPQTSHRPPPTPIDPHRPAQTPHRHIPGAIWSGWAACCHPRGDLAKRTPTDPVQTHSRCDMVGLGGALPLAGGIWPEGDGEVTVR